MHLSGEDRTALTRDLQSLLPRSLLGALLFAGLASVFIAFLVYALFYDTTPWRFDKIAGFAVALLFAGAFMFCLCMTPFIYWRRRRNIQQDLTEGRVEEVDAVVENIHKHNQLRVAAGSESLDIVLNLKTQLQIRALTAGVRYRCRIAPESRILLSTQQLQQAPLACICGLQLYAIDEMAGKFGQCKCGQAIYIPNPRATFQDKTILQWVSIIDDVSRHAHDIFEKTRGDLHLRPRDSDVFKPLKTEAAVPFLIDLLLTSSSTVAAEILEDTDASHVQRYAKFVLPWLTDKVLRGDANKESYWGLLAVYQEQAIATLSSKYAHADDSQRVRLFQWLSRYSWKIKDKRLATPTLECGLKDASNVVRKAAMEATNALREVEPAGNTPKIYTHEHSDPLAHKERGPTTVSGWEVGQSLAASHPRLVHYKSPISAIQIIRRDRSVHNPILNGLIRCHCCQNSINFLLTLITSFLDQPSLHHSIECPKCTERIDLYCISLKERDAQGDFIVLTVPGTHRVGQPLLRAPLSILSVMDNPKPLKSIMTVVLL